MKLRNTMHVEGRTDGRVGVGKCILRKLQLD
jgi:hypothetical protein